jgi:hypothetical protein
LQGVAALDKKGVGIVALGQRNQTSSDASFPETSRQMLRCLLAAAIAVRIKGQIDSAGGIAELLKLARIEVGSE